MLYPFKDQFILYEDIAQSLTGLAKIIEFKCHTGNPTEEQAFLNNQILSV